MKVSFHLRSKLGFLAFALVFFILPQITHAAVTSITGPATEWTIQNPRDTSGISSSCIKLAKDGANEGFFGGLKTFLAQKTGLGTYECADKAGGSGSFFIDPSNNKPVSYAKGDIIRGTVGLVSDDALVVVSHPDGTYTTYEATGFTRGLTTAQFDKSGKQTAKEEQGVASASATGLAATASAVSGDKINGPLTETVRGASNTIDSVGECIGNGLGKCILTAVATAILGIANFFLGIAGVMLNFVIFYGVIQFANTIGNSPGVLTAWGILRDLANMALLFGFIFMGVATILDTGGVQNFTAKRALPRLIIFAILMNFSLFACEAIIDVSNALTTSMYKQAAANDECFKASEIGTNGSSGGSISEKDCTANYGLAGHIMQTTGLSGIFAVSKDPNVSLGSSAVVYLSLALFATIGAIVFISAAVMLLIRLIMLTLLMVASPIGFAGMAIPPLRGLADEWWKRVIHQSMYAPVMLLLILISLKISDSFFSSVDKANNGLAGALQKPDASVMGIVFVFMLVIGFLIASIVAANRMGAAGATASIGIGKKIVLGSYGGIAGLTGRKSIGAASGWAQKKYKSSTGLRRFGLLTGLDTGIIKATEAGKNAKFGSSKSFADTENRKKEKNKIRTHLESIDKVKDATDASEMSNALKNISEADLPDLIKEMKGNKTQLKHIAQGLSAEKLDKLLKNKEFDDPDTKKKLQNLRYADLPKVVDDAEAAAQAYKANPTNAALKKKYDDAQIELGKATKALGGKDAGILAHSDHAKVLEKATFTAALSDDQFKAFKNNDDLSIDQKTTLEDTRTARLNDAGFVALRVPKMNSEDINKLRSDTLSHRDVLDAMHGRKLALIDPTKIGDDVHVNTIVNYIKSLRAGDPAKYADFVAQTNGDPNIEKRWKALGVI